MPDRDRIYEQLGLIEDAGLFVQQVTLDALGRKMKLTFLHQSGKWDSPVNQKFSLLFHDIHRLEMELQKDVADPDEALMMGQDVIGLNLGQDQWRELAHIQAQELTLQFFYKDMIAERIS